MAYPSPVGNPFLLMLNPEVVLAAIENSERLGKLDRRMCRPLDRHPVSGQIADDAAAHGEVAPASALDDR
jgi:hypothetical protein